MRWEGIEAKRKGVGLNTFLLEDYNIPYGYSPALLSHPEIVKEKEKAVANILKTTAKGFQWAASHPTKAAELLLPHTETDDLDFLIESQTYIAPYYLTADKRWGPMEKNRWTSFIHWLGQNELISQDNIILLNNHTLFTNDYLV